ncbi:MAG: hypothetical protein Q9182_002616 [Xanthomendoza sp. 2 TL-2023]
MHILTPEQGAQRYTQVLYKKRGGSSGYLGGGSFGTVHLETVDSECRDAPTIRAVKSISKRAAESSKVHWEQEVENLIVLSQHPNVFVKVFGWWEDDQSIFLPMEYFEASDLSKNKDLIRDEEDIWTISHQLAVGLHHMHRLNIIHRDIKPQVGILIDRLERNNLADHTVDMWSFGCLIYELFARKCPFDEDNGYALLDYIYDGVFPRRPLDDYGASSESIWLIENLLKREPHLRLSAQDALNSTWLNTTIAASPCAGPIQDPKAGGGIDPSSLSGSTVQGSPDSTLDSLSASLGAALHHTTATPPKLVFKAPDTSITEDSPLTPEQVLHRPSFIERAISLPENSLVQVSAAGANLPSHTVPIPDLPPRPRSSNSMIHISADDAAVPISIISQAPNLPPRPKSSNALRPNTLKDTSDSHGIGLAARASQISTLGTQSIESSSYPKALPIARKPVPQAMPTQMFPCLKTSRTTGDYIDMAFKNIKFKPQRKPTCDICESRRVFNPVIKPAALYFCKDCGHRPLCARCIVESIKNHQDPHEADHKLQLWIQAHTFPLQEFLDRFKPLDVETTEGVDPAYGKSWLYSDHSFTPPAQGAHGTRWVLNAPAGEFDMEIQIRVCQRKEAIESSAIGLQKSMLVSAKAVPLGSILFGARVIDSNPAGSQFDDSKGSRHLPDRPIEQEVKLAKEEQTITLKLGFKLSATTKQKIEVHIRGSYDNIYFKAGSPLKWWLEHITITQFGAEQHVASMGEKIMRENFKQSQAKQKRDQRITRGVGLVGQGIGIAGAKGPVKQGQVLLSAIGAGLGAGGSMMRQSNQRPVGQVVQQPAPGISVPSDTQEIADTCMVVYNNYYFSSNSFDTPPQEEQGYAYEQIEDEQEDYDVSEGEEQVDMWQQQRQQIQ